MYQTPTSYFNLIVRANPEEPMIESRMLEGSTEDALKVFGPKGHHDLSLLATLPTIMVKEFDEDDTQAYATVGYLDAPLPNPRITHPVMSIPATALLSCGILGRYENTRTHWAVREGDLFRMLAPYAVSNEASVFVNERLQPLGEGGFGAVYPYHHPVLDMDFAVKVFSPVFVSGEEELKAEKRFFREAKMLFVLNHPNIVRVYDVGRIKGRPFIKMELVEGESLQKLHDETGNLSFGDAAKAISQVLKGLQYAHAHGIIHRDLKPSNVMAGRDAQTGETLYKIIDFGVSAFMDTEGYTRITKTGEVPAGGQYIDPELSARPMLRDSRSDIFSAGAILYFILCGRTPGPDAEEYLRRSNAELTDEQVGAVMKALSSDLDQRYASCDEMRLAVERACR